MSGRRAGWPKLDRQALKGSKDALHAYAKILGNWLKSCQPKRKHWWHASLRPSLKGLTTGVVHAPVGFELELDLTASLLRGTTYGGAELVEPLQGQSAAELATSIASFLTEAGLRDAPEAPQDTGAFAYDVEQVKRMHEALFNLSFAFAELRARIPEETSPIQIWPHHFDLSMLWLPGEKIPGDPDDEEYSDKQMNFGFTFGDETFPDPYLYVTAYPTLDAMAELALPADAQWHREGFTGVVLDYARLAAQRDPYRDLENLLERLVAAGRKHMLERNA